MQDALRSLPFWKRVDIPLFGLLVWLGWLLGPFTFMMPLPWLLDVVWSYRVRRLVKGLDRGERLSALLRSCFAGHFPEFYLLGVEKAEADNRLEAALPVLAYQLNFPCDLFKERIFELLFVMKKILVSVVIILFIVSNIIPKFHEIFRDLGARQPMLAEQIAVFLAPFAQVVLVAMIIALIIPGMGGVGEYLVVHVPALGFLTRRFALAELARSMAVFLKQGDDVIAAAEWSLKATRSRWLRGRLTTCIQRMRNGERWDRAWQGMGLGRPLDEWLLSNSAVREDPASGFQMLAEWLQQDLELFSKRLGRWVDPVCTLVMALVVGSIACSVFFELAGAIRRLL